MNGFFEQIGEVVLISNGNGAKRVGVPFLRNGEVDRLNPNAMNSELHGNLKSQ